MSKCARAKLEAHSKAAKKSDELFYSPLQTINGDAEFISNNGVTEVV